MCGKFTQMASWAEVYAYASLIGASANDSVRVFTPMRSNPVVHLDETGARRVTVMGWAFTDRKPQGRRIPKHMHARGETVHRLPTFADAFRFRRGITWVKSFNEGEEVDVLYDDGAPNGKKWTRQWTYTPKSGEAAIIGVIYDTSNVGGGPEYEYVQVTTPANAVIGKVTDRMPLVLRPEDVAVWLGETDAGEDEVRALIRTMEFGEGWDAAPEDPTKQPPRPRRPKGKAGEGEPGLF
jgi:putative SOS response-associated peptidase YedK